MTEQTKIPLPREGDAKPASSTLIERAVDAFDWRRMAPPPVPQVLASPATAKRGGEGSVEQILRWSPKPTLISRPRCTAGQPAAKEDVPVAFPSKVQSAARRSALTGESMRLTAVSCAIWA